MGTWKLSTNPILSKWWTKKAGEDHKEPLEGGGQRK